MFWKVLKNRKKSSKIPLNFTARLKHTAKNEKLKEIPTKHTYIIIPRPLICIITLSFVSFQSLKRKEEIHTQNVLAYSLFFFIRQN